MKFTSMSLIAKLTIVGITGLFISACSSTMEGVGKDLQNMGASMGGANSGQQNNQSQTKGKDVVVTPVK
jgi:predicted small secreted protein